MIRYVLALLLLSASAAFPCSLTTTYVSPTGNDSNPGTKPSPFLTINHAISVATPGTTIRVMGTSYNEVATFLTQSGSPACDIVLQPDTSTVALRGINIVNPSYITIGPNFSISNQTAATPAGYGVHIGGTSHDITIASSSIHDLCHEGIFEESTVGGNILLTGDTIFKAQMAGVSISGNVGGALGTGTTAISLDISQTQQRPHDLGGIYSVCNPYVQGDDADWIRLFGGGHVIGQPGHGNNLHDIPHGTVANPINPAIGTEPHTDCFQTFRSGTPPLTNTIIEADTCRGSDTALHTSWIEEGGDIDGNTNIVGCVNCVHDITFRNDIFANLNQGVSPQTGWSSIRFLNVIFDHITQQGLIYASVPDLPGSDVSNTIFSDVGGSVGDGVISMKASSILPAWTTNVASMTRGGNPGTFCGLAQCPTSINVNPGFVSLGDATGLGADYHLTATSAIAAAGTTFLSFNKDMMGVLRPQLTAWAIGPLEDTAVPTPTATTSPTPTGTATPTATVTKTPTPTAACPTATPTVCVCTAAATPTATPTP